MHGAVHELLSDPQANSPLMAAALLTRAAIREGGAVVWSDPVWRSEGMLCPTALSDLGIPLERLIVLRPKDATQERWAIAECLRCKGVSITVAAVSRLSRVQARQFQLAAERGGGMGLLLRKVGKESACYAAATRWLVSPAPGDQATQRWKLELVHGHGGQVGQGVFLEVDRESGHVRAFPVVEHSAAQAQEARLRA